MLCAVGMDTALMECDFVSSFREESDPADLEDAPCMDEMVEVATVTVIMTVIEIVTMAVDVHVPHHHAVLDFE